MRRITYVWNRLLVIVLLASGGPAATSAGFADDPVDVRAQRRQQNAAAVAVSRLNHSGPVGTPQPRQPEPIALAHSTTPTEINRKTFDLVVVGATPGGIACAVRAAREGCSVLLVQHNGHIGGMMTNGLMQWDALYGGRRAPLFTELLHKIENHYVATCGENSQDHQVMRYTHEHYPIGWVEPHVAEREFNRLVAGEERIKLLLNHYPVAVTRQGALLHGLTLRQMGTTAETRVIGRIFADATYEGDLFALAKVPYKAGRESREEYGEPHAGKLFVNIDHTPAPQAAVDGTLNIRPYNSRQGSIDPASPGTADGAIQAYNLRVCVSRHPENRILMSEPPPGYNREEYVNYNRKSIATNAGPNLKSHMNSPILPGENHDYPEADWPTRQKITQRHVEFALGLIYFLQNDESVPAAAREKYREWGLAKDEFPDNHHIPYEIYVREARRIVGRHVLTEHDCSLAPNTLRTPLQPDSIATTDWYMDSHACTNESRPDYRYDGKLILTEESRPAQIPYRCLLPQGVDNLLVPVCLSATHVAWGAVRLEPVWMQTGEAAGFAAALCRQQGTTPARLDPDALLRMLARRGQLISFFNDAVARPGDAALNAAQYFGTKGFLASYDARLEDPLTEPVGQLWATSFAQLSQDELDQRALIQAMVVAETRTGPVMKAGDFLARLPASDQLQPADSEAGLTRREALQILWKLLKE